MLGTYILYIFRLDTLEKTLATVGENGNIGKIPDKKMKNLMDKNIVGSRDGETFEDILNIKRCVKPSNGNPFMNPLVFDSRLRDAACDAVKPENQLQIEREYNRHCIKDISDIWNHNSGRRQFYTVANTTYPNNQEAFANWLYKRGPSCKEGNGAQCIANIASRINSSLITPSFAQ